MRVVLWEDGGLPTSAMPWLATEVFGGAIGCYGELARNAPAAKWRAEERVKWGSVKRRLLSACRRIFWAHRLVSNRWALILLFDNDELHRVVADIRKFVPRGWRHVYKCPSSHLNLAYSLLILNLRLAAADCVVEVRRV